MLNRKQLDRLIADNPAVPGGLVTLGASTFRELTRGYRGSMVLIGDMVALVDAGSTHTAFWDYPRRLVAAWERDDGQS